eukprot:TRINITY_DN90968_c0_g1_i1.p1 TRINITY_DN90968_c0_g1~~TRINITY_DN90968_c0_g1_i1.p1  ORF type:complete len:380 (-),score=81.75 TRINITY_DN90968_c0_g1_i1:202-1341(-)
MAQAAANGRAMPFPAPPGLEHQMSQGAATDEVSATSSASRSGDTHEALRRAVLHDVDTKVSERVDELWQRGKQMLGQLQQKQQERAEKLAAEVNQCVERQQALERENESLKQVINQLASQLSQLGSPLAPVQSALAKPGAGSLSPLATTVGSSTSGTPPQNFGSDSFTPGQLSSSAGEGGYQSLPDVPPFPFAQLPTAAPGGAAPLSLAEALGPAPSTTASPVTATPLSLASSLPVPETAVLSPGVYGGGVFSMTLRKADQAELGLNVSPIESQRVLYVEGVRPDGAVDAWNRQCASSAQAEKAVIPGDRIVSVNNVSYDPDRMLEECKDKVLLKLTIVRGDYPLPELPGAPMQSSPVRSLRADASEFVPMGSTQAAEQ